jgi:hypothetical protein
VILLAKGTYFPDVLAALKKVLLTFKRTKKSLGIRSLHAGPDARRPLGLFHYATEAMVQSQALQQAKNAR